MPQRYSAIEPSKPQEKGALVTAYAYQTGRNARPEKGKSLIAFPEAYCVLDIETTGLSPARDHIIEIGALCIEPGDRTRSFQSLLQPPREYGGRYVSPMITRLTGITNAMLEEAPATGAVLAEFADFLGDHMILGYNVGFDVNFLYDGFQRYLGRPLTNHYVDVMRMARKLHPEMDHHRLQDMTQRFGIVNRQAHRALADVEATEACYRCLQKEAVEVWGSEKDFIRAFRAGGARRKGC